MIRVQGVLLLAGAFGAGYLVARRRYRTAPR